MPFCDLNVAHAEIDLHSPDPGDPTGTSMGSGCAPGWGCFWTAGGGDVRRSFFPLVFTYLTWPSCCVLAISLIGGVHGAEPPNGVYRRHVSSPKLCVVPHECPGADPRSAGFTPGERAAFGLLLGDGWVDAYRPHRADPPQ